MPFGGAYQLTPRTPWCKAAGDGETSTCSGMAWGFNPYLMSADQYKGARLAVVESVTKLVATGFRYEDAYLTFQEYFERLGTAPERWGKPLAACWAHWMPDGPGHRLHRRQGQHVRLL